MECDVEAMALLVERHLLALFNGFIVTPLFPVGILAGERFTVLLHLAAVGKPLDEDVLIFGRLIDGGFAVFVEVAVVPEHDGGVLLGELSVGFAVLLHAPKKRGEFPAIGKSGLAKACASRENGSNESERSTAKCLFTRRFLPDAKDTEGCAEYCQAGNL